MCNTCKRVIPLALEDESVDADVDWVCCNSCTCWYHMICVGVLSAEVPAYWQCLNCVELWEFEERECYTNDAFLFTILCILKLHKETLYINFIHRRYNGQLPLLILNTTIIFFRTFYCIAR